MENMLKGARAQEKEAGRPKKEGMEDDSDAKKASLVVVVEPASC